MADVRETVLLDHMDTSRFRLPPGSRLKSRIKLGIRWLVVATSHSPLRPLYIGIYEMHVRYALRVLRRFPGIQSIYVTGGVATGDIKPGISDIDLTVNGEWSDEDQIKIANALRRLSRLSPLYDTLLGQCVQTIPSLLSLYETDYFFQYRFNQGRFHWKLLHGQDVFALLPAVPEERLAGGFYTEARTWWSYFVRSAFGEGPMADDAIFRRTIAHKSHAGILNIASALKTNVAEQAREVVLKEALTAATVAEKVFLNRLLATAKKPHRSYDGDIQEDTLPFNLRALEKVHSELESTSSFQPAGESLTVDGSHSELLFAPGTQGHVQELIQFVRQRWSGFQSAFLVPSISFFNMDDLVCLIEVSPDQLPTVKQIRELCRWHKIRTGHLKQRIALFLLLPKGAYQIEIVSTIELWHHLLCPLANPEVFALLSRDEFLLAGTSRPPSAPPLWTRFANDLVSEELMIRRSALSKIGAAAAMQPLEILRNLWRHLQLEIIERSAARGHALVPVTLPSIQRAMQSWGVPPLPVFDQLRQAYVDELNGKSTDIRPLIDTVMAIFGALQAQTSPQYAPASAAAAGVQVYGAEAKTSERN